MSPLQVKPSYIERRRLEYLRELYVRDEITVPQLEGYVEAVLRGRQPEGDGLPIAPDPALEYWVERV